MLLTSGALAMRCCRLLATRCCWLAVCAELPPTLMRPMPMEIPVMTLMLLQTFCRLLCFC